MALNTRFQLPLCSSPRYATQGKLRRWKGARRRCLSEEGVPEGDLTTQFSQFVLQRDLQSAPPRHPSHLLPPSAVVECQLAALQRNDWPEIDAGIQTAFAFTKPDNPEQLTPPHERRCRAWTAEERYLTLEAFREMILATYHPLIQFESYEVISEMVFPSRRKDVAVQAVNVTFESPSGDTRGVIYTFCLERMASGSLKNCWMTVGVRRGNYAT